MIKQPIKVYVKHDRHTNVKCPTNGWTLRILDVSYHGHISPRISLNYYHDFVSVSAMWLLVAWLTASSSYMTANGKSSTSMRDGARVPGYYSCI